MSESVFARQQARKRAEVWYGPWDATREAIIAARGARETSDVAAEELEPLFEVVAAPLPDDVAWILSPGRHRRENESLAEYGKHFAVGLKSRRFNLREWFMRLLYGPPIDYDDSRLP